MIPVEVLRYSGKLWAKTGEKHYISYKIFRTKNEYFDFVVVMGVVLKVDARDLVDTEILKEGYHAAIKYWMISSLFSVDSFCVYESSEPLRTAYFMANNL